MKLKFALLLSVLMVAFISTHAFAEDKEYKKAQLDWHNAIKTFMQKVKVAEGFDYHASENSNLWTALDVEVKRLADEKENENKGHFFFLCKAHKKVMRQLHSASYDLVKLGSICSTPSSIAENWMSTGKNDRGEYFRDMASIKSEAGFVVVKDKIVFAEQQNNDSLIYQIVITDYAIDCNAKTAAATSYSYNNLGGEVITAFEIPRSKWSFDSEGYKALGMAGVCILSGTPATPTKLESSTDRANKIDADRWKSVGNNRYIDINSVQRVEGLTYIWLKETSINDQENSYKLTRWAINCRNNTFDLISSESIDSSGKAKNNFDREPAKWKFMSARPGSFGESIVNTACSDISNPESSARDKSETNVSPKLSSTGSGFLVNANGYLLTNHHVANGCSNLKIRDSSKIEHDVAVVATDARNDLALLKTIASVTLPAAAFRANSSVEAGENVVALGYPLAGVLASEVNVSFGYVSATAGLADDTSKMQISAPVQPGNSGGPLLDQAGNLIGVVVAKLDAIKVAKAIGDIPQNINFAVKGEVAQVFLKAHKVKFKTATATKKLQNTDIASRGRAFTVLVECYK